MPYVYIDGIASLEIIGSKGKEVIKGQEHIINAWDGRKPSKVFEDYCEGRIEMHGEARVLSSISKMAEKEQADCDIRLSDYIEETWRKQPTLYGINHPTQHVLFEAFRRLCSHVGWDYDPGHKDNPVAWGRRALPNSPRSLTPYDAKALELKYSCDTHWYGNAHKMIMQIVKNAQLAQIASGVD